ncbi:VWA domain-containing protein [Betaproteobacteria bacterium SCN2]|jgi:nitric oxide reductase NorD protein|nr:VWA domain-containing protein [Betaproteobacteria bacterium SCN2]
MIPYTPEQLALRLETAFDVEFTFHKVDKLVDILAPLDRDSQDFILGWVDRIASTNIQISYEFTRRVVEALDRLDRRVIEAWAVHAMDTYDSKGLHPALEVLRKVDDFLAHAHAHAAGAFFDEVKTVLSNFLCGLSGRRLALKQGEQVHTDSERLFLPNVSASMETEADNFLLCKARVAFMWAQTRFGSCRVDFAAEFAGYDDPARALAAFQALDNLRLEACLARELPGLWRDMQGLSARHRDAALAPGWQAFEQALARDPDKPEAVLALLREAYTLEPPAPRVYHAALDPQAIAGIRNARMAREKMLLRVKLAQLAQEQREEAAPQTSDKPAEEQAPAQFEARQDGQAWELTLDDQPVAPPEDVKQLLTSVSLDWGEIPPEMLTAAGDGEYDPALYEDKEKDPNEVWQGTYHEEGAHIYPEWDFARQHYRKNWCVLREIDLKPGDAGYVDEVIDRHHGLVKHLRRTFEAMRDESKLLKRQVQGDDVDIDALVEALADSMDGREMSDQLFMHMHRADRSMAVMFMVDMSGSTRGWINDAEREALIMLCESLETLGDRYAIYGFSGQTRKRCEIYRIKTFDQPYDDATRARIAGIVPRDYTRMGAAIRHLSKLLNEVDAKTKLLITLSDGKPDDYFDIYRGQYGIEDTRQALFEARRSGIHPFCITIDREGKEYLPHMYGHANWVEIDEVRKLPLKVADIYRRLTT